MIFLAADHNGNALAKKLCQMINDSENLKLFFDNYNNKPSLEAAFSINKTQNEVQNKLQNMVKNNSKFEIKNESKINLEISKNSEFIKETKNKNTQIAQILVIKTDPNDDYPDIAKLLVDNLLYKPEIQIENICKICKIQKNLKTDLENDKMENNDLEKTKNMDFGIAICGTGQGICMSLNRFSKIRAGVLSCVNAENLEELLKITQFLRFHNNANVLCFPCSSDPKIAFQLIQKFVQTPFSTEERHTRRIKKLDD